MVSGRPLLYLSLPGVAFILGVFWFRRRNKNRPDNNVGDINSGCKEITKIKHDTANEELLQKVNANSVTANKSASSQCMNINGTLHTATEADENTVNKLFGKSAPIKIIQNGRNSPVKQPQQQQIDSEVLKTKIQDVEHKALRSIDEDLENLSSPVDLPDSVNKRLSFYARNVNTKQDEPVVIKATRTPKISPENSFLESKYTKECEQNNNCELSNGKSDVEHKLVKTHSHKAVKQQRIEEGEEENIAKMMENNNNNNNDDDEKREVDAASPSLSLCSLQSGDSGKGSSLPRSEATRAKSTYEFFLPACFLGKFFSQKHSFMNQIKSKTSANIVIRKNTHKLHICSLEGTESEINAALLMIRQRLPAKNYPNFTMQRIHFALPQSIVPLSVESLLNLQLNLIEGINNDVVVSAVITGGHLFVQQPLHPSHPSLAVLQKCLYESYSATKAPLLPRIELSAVCVMAVNGIWYRVQIVEQDVEDDQRCVVKFLDFGGYMNVHFNELRQIRSNFMGLPFQATECVLSNLEPIDEWWTPEAADILSKLTKGIVLQAQVAGYNSHNIPEIYLFACLGPNNVIFINKELVARNLAQWVEVTD